MTKESTHLVTIPNASATCSIKDNGKHTLLLVISGCRSSIKCLASIVGISNEGWLLLTYYTQFLQKSHKHHLNLALGLQFLSKSVRILNLHINIDVSSFCEGSCIFWSNVLTKYSMSSKSANFCFALFSQFRVCF